MGSVTSFAYPRLTPAPKGDAPPTSSSRPARRRGGRELFYVWCQQVRWWIRPLVTNGPAADSLTARALPERSNRSILRHVPGWWWRWWRRRAGGRPGGRGRSGGRRAGRADPAPMGRQRWGRHVRETVVVVSLSHEPINHSIHPGQMYARCRSSPVSPNRRRRPRKQPRRPRRWCRPGSAARLHPWPCCCCWGGSR